jgi:hypothetical protein
VLLVLLVYVLQDNIAVLGEPGSSSADKAQALANLQVLVEPIDNANGEQPAAAAAEGDGQPASQLTSQPTAYSRMLQQSSDQ